MQLLQHELIKAGIFDLSDILGEHQQWESWDLFENSGHKPAHENLSEMIKTALCYIQDLRIKEQFECLYQHYIFATKQGVHIEIPSTIFNEATKPDSTLQSRHLDMLMNINMPKVELAQQFVEN